MVGVSAVGLKLIEANLKGNLHNMKWSGILFNKNY